MGQLGLEKLNTLPLEKACDEFLRCCGSRRWASAMAAARPFQNAENLYDLGQKTWLALAPRDWLEAFGAHPKIGDRKALQSRFKETRHLASAEQSEVNGASPDVLDDLARGNQDYEKKFGYIFIICATGKTASEMLGLLRSRLGNSPEKELRIAAEEQSKITRMRLEKLIAVK